MPILYVNFVTKELCLTNLTKSMAGMSHCVQQGNKFSLLHKNFNFTKNTGRNLHFILGYRIFTLVLIISKSFKEKSRLNFSFYSFIVLTLVILKPALEPTKSDQQSQLRKYFTFFSVEVLDLCNRLNDSYYHYQDCFIAIFVLKYKNYTKFYKILLLLSRDISLNPGPAKAFLTPFGNLLKIRGLHFLHSNINGNLKVR